MTKRRYAPVWNQLKEQGHCTVSCAREATHTIISMVKKEKNIDPNKPKGKKLSCEVTATGVLFKLIEDVSINNL